MRCHTPHVTRFGRTCLPAILITRQALQVDRDGLMTSVTAYLEEGRLADVTLHPPPLQFTMMREMARQQVLRQDTEGALIRLREALSLEPQESHGHLLTVRLVLEILSNRVLKACGTTLCQATESLSSA